MQNYDRLCAATQTERITLLNTPIIHDVQSGRVELTSYHAFLSRAYHHVRHTIPLMAATVSHIAPDRTRLTRALKHYINEEFGHEEWILNDLQAAGADVRPVLDSGADMATEVMVAYVRDYITTVHPVGFFGMVHVLEGTSTELASNMADLIQHHLHLPDAAFTYLRSHGELDIGHVSLFQELLDDLNDAEMAHVIHVAAIVYPLYRNVLDSIPRVSDSSAA